MEFQTFVFYVFSALAIFAAVRVVTASNPVHAVLFLVLAFFNAGGLWLTLQAEFLALALIMVYVGAVMVLFLFVVMMLDIDFAKLREGFWKYLPVAATVGVGRGGVGGGGVGGGGDLGKLREGFWKYLPDAVTVAVVLVGEMIALIL